MAMNHIEEIYRLEDNIVMGMLMRIAEAAGDKPREYEWIDVVGLFSSGPTRRKMTP